MLQPFYSNIQKCIRYRHGRTENPPTVDFHLHNQFEIYFLVSGNVHYLIEKKVYPLKYGDLLVINNLEIHKPTFFPGERYERIVVHFDPSLPALFNNEHCNLLHPFSDRPKGEHNKINLTKSQIDEINQLFDKIEVSKDDTRNDAAIIQITYFIQLLIFIQRVFAHSEQTHEYSEIPEKLSLILDYIDLNLESDLSLQQLAKKFFINHSYLSSLFKKHIGNNIHEYIIYKRISLAKKLLAEDYDATEVCLMSGFNDYANFSRMFKRTVGISPGHFKNDSKHGFRI